MLIIDYFPNHSSYDNERRSVIDSGNVIAMMPLTVIKKLTKLKRIKSSIVIMSIMFTLNMVSIGVVVASEYSFEPTKHSFYNQYFSGSGRANDSEESARMTGLKKSQLYGQHDVMGRKWIRFVVGNNRNAIADCSQNGHSNHNKTTSLLFCEHDDRMEDHTMFSDSGRIWRAPAAAPSAVPVSSSEIVDETNTRPAVSPTRKKILSRLSNPSIATIPDLSVVSFPPSSHLTDSTRLVSPSSQLFESTRSDGDDSGEYDPKDVEGSPIVYRYFGRRRGSFSANIPVLVLGPTADHWKDAGNALASHGIHVMACQETFPSKTSSRKGYDLVAAVLEALRWKKAIVIGCGPLAVRAIEAAVHLGPEKVAGLILCGDLTEADMYASRASVEMIEDEYEYEEDEDEDFSMVTENEHEFDNSEIEEDDEPEEEKILSLNQFLERYLDSPFLVMRDGISIDDESQLYCSSVRPTILGGGIDPHRRRPDQFAWVVTRFVEERVLSGGEEEAKDVLEKRISIAASPRGGSAAAVRTLPELLWSPESFLVAGRFVASTLFYVSALSVAVHQYWNVASGLSDAGFTIRQVQRSLWRSPLGRFLLKSFLRDLNSHRRDIVKKATHQLRRTGAAVVDEGKKRLEATLRKSAGNIHEDVDDIDGNEMKINSDDSTHEESPLSSSPQYESPQLDKNEPRNEDLPHNNHHSADSFFKDMFHLRGFDYITT